MLIDVEFFSPKYVYRENEINRRLKGRASIIRHLAQYKSPFAAFFLEFPGDAADEGQIGIFRHPSTKLSTASQRLPLDIENPFFSSIPRPIEPSYSGAVARQTW